MKNTFKRRIGQTVQFPGALVCIALYTLLTLFGVTNRIGDARVKSSFMVAIPWVSGVVWLAAIVWAFYAWHHGTTTR